MDSAILHLRDNYAKAKMEKEKKRIVLIPFINPLLQLKYHVKQQKKISMSAINNKKVDCFGFIIKQTTVVKLPPIIIQPTASISIENDTDDDDDDDTILVLPYENRKKILNQL
jgi:hypothetical protein